MSKNLSKEEIQDIQDRICELIYRAESFLKWSNQLLSIYEKERDSLQNHIKKQYKFYKNPITKCIILHQVLYFQEAVIDLHTLFERKGRPTEISFKYYFTNTEKSNLVKEIDKIRKEYKTAHLDKFRNRLFAHKQVDAAGDPFTGFFNPIKKEHIEKACLIVDKLRSLTNRYFNCASNNYFEGYYKPGFEILYKTCETAFKKQNPLV